MVDVVAVHGIRGLRVDEIESVASCDPQHPDGTGWVRRELFTGDDVQSLKLPDLLVAHVTLVHVQVDPEPGMCLIVS